MQIESNDREDLDSFEGVLPPREKWEFRAQTDARTDAQLAREQTLQARAQNKTSAQMASEIAQVHKLTTLLAEQVDFLADLACSRHGFMDQVKTRTTAKADKKDSNEGLEMTLLNQRLTSQVCPLLAVLTRRQWTWMMLSGALLAPPPAQLGCQ